MSATAKAGYWFGTAPETLEPPRGFVFISKEGEWLQAVDEKGEMFFVVLSDSGEKVVNFIKKETLSTF